MGKSLKPSSSAAEDLVGVSHRTLIAPLVIEIVEQIVMDTESIRRIRITALGVRGDSKRESLGNPRCAIKPDDHIRDDADRTVREPAGNVIPGRKEIGGALLVLMIPPGVLRHVAFEQYANRILHLHYIPYIEPETVVSRISGIQNVGLKK